MNVLEAIRLMQVGLPEMSNADLAQLLEQSAEAVLRDPAVDATTAPAAIIWQEAAKRLRAAVT